VSKPSFDRSQFIMMFFAFSLGMVLSNLLSQSKAEAPEPAAEILFTYKGIDKTEQDISTHLREALSGLVAERYALLERAALEQYLYDYAEIEGLEVAEAGEKLFKLEEPSKQEVSEFFTKNADKIKKPFFEVESEIKRQLVVLKAQQAKREALDYLASRGDLVIFPKADQNNY